MAAPRMISQLPREDARRAREHACRAVGMAAGAPPAHHGASTGSAACCRRGPSVRSPTRCSRSASAASPCTHGPHWPAEASLSQSARAATSATGQAEAPRRTTTPAPTAASKWPSEALSRVSALAVAIDPGAEVAADEQGPDGLEGPAGERRQGADREPERDLVDAGLGDRPREADERRTRVLGRARPRETRPGP